MPPGSVPPSAGRADRPTTDGCGSARVAPSARAPARRAHARRSRIIEARIRATPEALPRPRLLACDIDGTILDDRGILQPPVRRALAAISRSGVEVVLATGRSPWNGIAGLVGALGLRGPQITMQGALLSLPVPGRVVRLRALPLGVFRDAIRFADELGLDPIVTVLDGHRAERLPETDELFVSPLGDGRDFRYVSDLERLAEERPIRVFLPTGPERHPAVRRAATIRFGPRASIVWSDLTGLEPLAPGTNKGEAVAWLAASRGIDLAETAAVGDAPNDTEMLLRAGRSAAMGSAPASVRARADVVVPASRDLGVLDAFAWFFPDLAAEFGTGADRRPVRLP